MKIKLLFFGNLVDVIGINEMSLSDLKNTSELNNYLQTKYPGLKKMTFRIAVNREIVNDVTELKEGDEIALLPPFAGG